MQLRDRLLAQVVGVDDAGQGLPNPGAGVIREDIFAIDLFVALHVLVRIDVRRRPVHDGVDAERVVAVIVRDAFADVEAVPVEHALLGRRVPGMVKQIVDLHFAAVYRYHVMQVPMLRAVLTVNGGRSRDHYEGDQFLHKMNL